MSKDIGFSVKSLVLIIVCYAITAIVGYFCGYKDIFFNDNTYDIPIACVYIAGLPGVIATLLVAKQFVHIPILSYIGRYSIIVLITHLQIYEWMDMFVDAYLQQYDTALLWLCLFILLILIEVPVISFCRKYLPYIFAQKEVLKI